MQIYLAGPLFCDAERAFNVHLTEKLEDQGFTVFLPQRDGVESNQPPYDAMSKDELCQAIFRFDRDMILKSDIFLFILDGRVPDEGACVELGIAYAQKHLLERNKLLIGLHTDLRGGFSLVDTKLNAMVHSAFDMITNHEADLFSALGKFRMAAIEANS